MFYRHFIATRMCVLLWVRRPERLRLCRLSLSLFRSISLLKQVNLFTVQSAMQLKIKHIGLLTCLGGDYCSLSEYQNSLYVHQISIFIKTHITRQQVNNRNKQTHTHKKELISYILWPKKRTSSRISFTSMFFIYTGRNHH